MNATMNWGKRLGGMLLAVCSLSACGGGNNNMLGGSSSGSTALGRGALIQNPPSLISGVTAMTLAGVPQCDINVYHIEYVTVGVVHHRLLAGRIRGDGNTSGNAGSEHDRDGPSARVRWPAPITRPWYRRSVWAR
jgi:hypothetical protein